jgi:putative glutamine amidotransferase
LLTCDLKLRAAVTLNTFGIFARVGPYEAAMLKAGIEPVRNPDSLAGLSGLLLTGGSDVNPRRYGQERLRQSDSPDDARDELEFGLLKAALAADIPVFAICRGLQLLNVFQGGSLIQHLASSDVHRQKVDGVARGSHPAAHRVRVEPDTKLAAIVGAGELEVNSRHHQAVDRLGDGLTVSALSADGVVEGLELPEAAFAVAVQWHPEDRVNVSEADRKLFQAFADAMVRRG